MWLEGRRGAKTEVEQSPNLERCGRPPVGGRVYAYVAARKDRVILAREVRERRQ